MINCLLIEPNQVKGHKVFINNSRKAVEVWHSSKTTTLPGNRRLCKKNIFFFFTKAKLDFPLSLSVKSLEADQAVSRSN